MVGMLWWSLYLFGVVFLLLLEEGEEESRDEGEGGFCGPPER